MREALSVKKWLAPLVVAILTLVCMQAHATLGMLGGAASGAVVGSTWFGATLPTAPTTFTTSSSPPAAGSTCRGSYYTPGVGGDSGMSLQTALNDAAAGNCANGDVIELQAGTTYTAASTFSLPTRTGTVGWVYIISSDAPELGGSGLPSDGARVCPFSGITGCTNNTALSDMASIRSSCTSCNGNVITRASAAQYYRLVGLDIEVQDSNASQPQYIIVFNNGDTSVTTQAQHITIDRCYVGGAPTNGIIHAIQIDGAYMEVSNSYVDGKPLQTTYNADSQAIVGWNSTGPFLINNNYLTAAGETTMFGGADVLLPSPAEPSDITITNNHYYKPMAIFNGSITSGSSSLTINSTSFGTVSVGMTVTDANSDVQGHITSIVGSTATMSLTAVGTASSVQMVAGPVGKNMVEFKSGIRVVFKNNFLENAGAAGQARSAFTLTARNGDQDGTNHWIALTDYDIENNVFTNAAYGGTNWLLQDTDADGGATQAAHRILFRNNMIIMSVDLGGEWYDMHLLDALGPDESTDIILDHNDFIATAGAQVWLDVYGSTSLTWISNAVWSNNIYDAVPGGSGFSCQGSYNCTYANTVTAQIAQVAFLKNVMTGNAGTIPSGNFSPASESAVGYTSYGSNTAASGYALTSGSTYHAAGVSGAGLPYTSPGTSDGTDIGANISLLPTS